MADYYGDILLGDTIDIQFTTEDATGAAITLGGSPVVSAYIGNSTTEITAGITLTVDFDGRTGFHNVRLVATSGNGYATATNVGLVVTGGTVGGVSVTRMIGAFSIAARTGAITAAIFARAFSASYSNKTFDEMIKIMSAVLAGIASGLGTSTGTFRNLANTGDVVVATVDANGNRSAVTLTP